MNYPVSFTGLIGLLLVSFLVAPVALPQEQGNQAPPQQAPPGAPPGGTPGQQPGQPGQSPFPSPRDPRQPQVGDPRERSQFPEMQRPMFLSGKVVLDDGTPPPDSVVIERICNGVVRPEGYTDSKGRFSFQLGQNTAMMPDASVGSSDPSFGGVGGQRSGGGFGGFGGPGGRGISERDLMGCELRASLPGYRSEIVNLSGRRFMDNPDVGTIVLRRLGNVEGLTISATSLNAPKDAKKAYEKGRDEAKKQKWDKALKEFEKAVAVYPKYAAAWFDLGLMYEQTKEVDKARNAYEQSLAADAKFVKPYIQMALLSARDEKWQDVADTTDRVLKLNPFDFPQAYFYNSVANFNLQKMDKAEESAREGLKLDTQHRLPKMEHLLGIILAQKQDYSNAAKHMNNYLEFAPNAKDADMVRQQLQQIEKFTGKSTTAQQP